MQILNVAGYKFTRLSDLPSRRTALLERAHHLGIKGTILLSLEGINLNLAGFPERIELFINEITNDPLFSDINFHESYSTYQPFKYMRVKIKKEIITLRQAHVDPINETAPAISPAHLKQWIDEKRDFTLLDTRNDYEFQFGTFENATHLQIKDFGEFPKAMEQIQRDKPVVMFCTGGIRCEKAAIVMQNAGYQNVYQLQGGILGYFKEVGGDYFKGECFVFDQRVAVDASLTATGTKQCQVCQGRVSLDDQSAPTYIPGVSCPSCISQNKENLWV